MRKKALRKITALFLILLLLLPGLIACGGNTDDGDDNGDDNGDIVQTEYEYDLVIYGDTAAAVIASVAASRQSVNVALVAPGTHLGGMLSGGLSRTDLGDSGVIGGMSREFFMRNGAKKGKTTVDWYAEPKVAEAILNEMLGETQQTNYGVDVFLKERIVEGNGVVKSGASITQIKCESGKTFKAVQFIDATYEGDIMAQTGVTYTYGREGRNEYNELLAGVVGPGIAGANNHQFDYNIKARDAQGKLLYQEVSEEPLAEHGSADKKTQAYNFRMCLTQAATRVAYPKPEGYDPARYALLLEYIKAWVSAKGSAPSATNLFIAGAIGTTGKYDFNNRGAFSTDYIGGSYNYPDSTYAEREMIWEEHYKYTAGLFYFLANDTNVPKATRDSMNSYGLAADEFTDNNNWPFQLYVREGRRMIGEYVMTQQDIERYGTSRTKPDSIGMGSYNSDSHNVQRYINADGYIKNEGNMEVPVAPYEIPYRMILPKQSEVDNLLVTCTFSASHVAYSSIRMEPQYMIIGEAAGTAASIALKDKVKVHGISVDKLQTILKTGNGILSKGSDTVTNDYNYHESGVLFYDSFDKYTDGWSIVEGVTGATAVTQNASAITIKKVNTSTHGFITRKTFSVPTTDFTYSFRAKLNSKSAAEFSIRCAIYSIKAVLTRGDSAAQGTIQDEYKNPTRTFALDTSVWHDYQVVVHKNTGDFTYDIYVDGMPAWSGAESRPIGTSIIKIGADNAGNATGGGAADFDLEYFKMETGTKTEDFRLVASVFKNSAGNKLQSMADASGTVIGGVVLENTSGAAQQVKILMELFRSGTLIDSSNQTESIGNGVVKELNTSLTIPSDKNGLSIKVTVLYGSSYETSLLPDGITL